MSYIGFQKDDTCIVHKKESAFYCRDEGCQRGLCNTCVVKEHKLHDFVEMIDEKERLVTSLTEDIGTCEEQLQKNREKLLEAKLEAGIRNGLCLTELKTSKKEILRKISDMFDESISRVAQYKTEINMKIEDEMEAVNGMLNMMQQTKTLLSISLSQSYLSSYSASMKDVPNKRKMSFTEYYAYDGAMAKDKMERFSKYIIPRRRNAREDEAPSQEPQSRDLSARKRKRDEPSKQGQNFRLHFIKFREVVQHTKPHNLVVVFYRGRL